VLLLQLLLQLLRWKLLTRMLMLRLRRLTNVRCVLTKLVRWCVLCQWHIVGVAGPRHGSGRRGAEVMPHGRRVMGVHCFRASMCVTVVFLDVGQDRPWAGGWAPRPEREADGEKSRRRAMRATDMADGNAGRGAGTMGESW
jgi:hypothetical protein